MSEWILFWNQLLLHQDVAHACVESGDLQWELGQWKPSSLTSLHSQLTPHATEMGHTEYYDLLGVSPRCTEKELTRAYRQKVPRQAPLWVLCLCLFFFSPPGLAVAPRQAPGPGIQGDRIPPVQEDCPCLWGVFGYLIKAVDRRPSPSFLPGKYNGWPRFWCKKKGAIIQYHQIIMHCIQTHHMCACVSFWTTNIFSFIIHGNGICG